jgi:hypothetical protein
LRSGREIEETTIDTKDTKDTKGAKKDFFECHAETA